MSVEDTLSEFQDELDRVDEGLQEVVDRLDNIGNEYDIKRFNQDLQSSKQEDIRRGIEALCSVLRLPSGKAGVQLEDTTIAKLKEFIGALKP